MYVIVAFGNVELFIAPTLLYNEGHAEVFYREHIFVATAYL